MLLFFPKIFSNAKEFPLVVAALGSSQKGE